jgi:fatty-acyl-CoA synthase
VVPNNMYAAGMEKTVANYVPLTPLSHIERTAMVYPHRPSVVHGERCFTWAQTYARCRSLASALKRCGVTRGDTVATILPNVPALYEAHFGVPMLGAVLNALNTRLDAASIAYMLRDGEAKVLLTDPEFALMVEQALALLGTKRPVVIDVRDPLHVDGAHLGELEYEEFLAAGDPEFAWELPSDEWDALCLNYTSGTTGKPKGVVYHHRGAYLNAVSNILSWNMPPFATFLWTLPMFHCNGWCFPWTMAANAGLNVCLRTVDPESIFDLIRLHHVTHLCGAPIIYSVLINAPRELRNGIGHPMHGLIAGATPPLAVLEGAEQIGIDLTHVYGLTEVYGPAAVCAKQPEWSDFPLEERTRLNGRQGVPYHLQQAVRVLDAETLEPVPHDGETMGEIFFRGNIVMKGYLKDAEATRNALAGGWFHTGDLAVVHPDGYIKIKDRSKDIIISGGENVSSIEVEDALYRHPAVLAAAVIALPDPKWGEVPCAFVELREGKRVNAAELIAWCRAEISHYKAPRHIVFGSLPRSATGKIQKFVLRQQLQSSSAIE